MFTHRSLFLKMLIFCIGECHMAGVLADVRRLGHFLTSQGLNHNSIENPKNTAYACPRYFDK